MSHPFLSWKNKQPPAPSKPVSPILTERHHSPTTSNQLQLFQGDNKALLEHLRKTHQGKINLIYLDPPFDSDANYNRIIRLRGDKTPYFIQKQQYHDQWERHEYLQFIYERLYALRDLLADDGSIYLHADWHRIHHLRLIMDEVFGEENLLNEIIWHHDFGGRSPHFLARKHDNLLLYKKGNTWKFNLNTLPDLPYQGNLHRYQNKKTKKGKKPTAVWHDIQPSDFVWDIAYENKMSPHNTGYPTQKPAALLQRIIELSSEPNDWILDPFLGSGTTAVVSQRLGRNCIGIDSNWDSLHTTRNRLLSENQRNNIELYQDLSFPDFPLTVEYQIEKEQLVLSLSCPDIQELFQIPDLEWKHLDWRTWIQSILINWSADSQFFYNPLVDSPLSKKLLVKGSYPIPPEASKTITMEITDILCRTIRFSIHRQLYAKNYFHDRTDRFYCDSGKIS